MDGMARLEAMEILKLYRGWNLCQIGHNDQEEEILVERRKLLKKAYTLLGGE